MRKCKGINYLCDREFDLSRSPNDEVAKYFLHFPKPHSLFCNLFFP